MDNEQGRETAAHKALAMLDTFARVGAKAFDVTLLDIEGKEQGFQRNRSLDELRRSMGRRLEAATATRHSLVIRPRSNTALLIQLDDFTPDKAAEIEPYAFLTLRTSPGNYQVWFAVSDAPKESAKEAAKQFRTRVRRGAGADHSARPQSFAAAFTAERFEACDRQTRSCGFGSRR
jgi:RepB DNA-primase from phage plasmid